MYTLTLRKGSAIMPAHGEYESLPDEELIEKCLSRDMLAWETLLCRYERYIYSIISRGFHFNASDAKDVFQECVIKLLKGLGNLRDRKHFKGYLISIVRNCCLDHVRPPAEDPLPDGLPLPDTKPHRDDVNAVINKLELERCIKKLSPEFQDVVRLFFYEGCTLDEIAARLRISRELAGVRNHRALKKLKEYMGEFFVK